MSSTSYTYFKSLFDIRTFQNYISKTLPTVQSVTTDGISIVITFPIALTSVQELRLISLVTAFRDQIVDNVSTPPILLPNTLTYTPLAANATFTSPWTSIQGLINLQVFVLADKQSAVNGLQIQFGTVKQQVDITRSYSVNANFTTQLKADSLGSWMRIVYQNSNAVQTQFSLQVRCFQSAFTKNSTLCDTMRNLSLSETTATSTAMTQSMQTATCTKTVSQVPSGFVPLFTINNATTGSTTSIVLTDLFVSCKGDSGTVTVGLVRDCTLYGSTFNPVSTTAIATVDVASTSHTNGSMIVNEVMSPNTSTRFSLSDYCIKLNGNSTVTVVCKLNAASSPTIVSASLNWREI